MSLIFFVLLFSGAKTEEATPSSLLSPRHFNHHAFAAKYGQDFRVPETTKQGPVLFPNDAPPPPRPPLIVTSRPLLESIARSDLNTDPQNNTIPQGTQISSIIKPFLARVKDYRPFAYAIATPPTQDYDYERYDDYEHQKPVLPPIYKAIADHAKQKVVKIQQQRQKDRYEYQQVKTPDYYNHHHKSNDINSHDESDGNDEQNKNYAFSYRVKDQKTGDDFSHRQHSKGSATNGEYRVRLPDGRMQIVSYTADENGYQADVRYDDEDKTSGNSIDNNKHNYIYNQNDNYQHNNKINDHHNFDDHQTYDRHNYDYKHNDYDKNKYDRDYSQQSDYKADYRTDVKSPSNDYYNQYSDGSKEYYNDDFSKEFESKSYDYAPHKSKFSSFIEDQNTNVNQNLNIGSVSTVKPSYEELKDLLVTKNAYNTVQPSYFTRAPVSINVPSTTPSSLNFGSTTERVVLIGGKKTNFYTNIRNVPLVSTVPVSVTESPVKYGTASDFSVSPTPMSYLVSTIASLRNRVDLSGPKPVLSNSYIDRINKYLTFNK
ncbi:GATA zinc finger domain-containing protein 14-like [Ostrinia furnacalis]|uniref:GATA zinc finger domain-containing protein 14-like n=1 Tax=Ostrinia furnacalis TaxID=93504 RepID=UPI00103EF315|nr:GATA zinc finger domain-containing protein 14-like [Ostrinia furnacalis]